MEKLEFVAATAYVYRMLAAKSHDFPIHMGVKRGVEEEYANAYLAAQVCVALGGDREYYAHEARVEHVEPASAELLDAAAKADIEEFQDDYNAAVNFDPSPWLDKIRGLQTAKREARRNGDHCQAEKLTAKAQAIQAELKAVNPIKAFAEKYGSYLCNLFVEGTMAARM